MFWVLPSFCTGLQLLDPHAPGRLFYTTPLHLRAQLLVLPLHFFAELRLHGEVPVQPAVHVQQHRESLLRALE